MMPRMRMKQSSSHGYTLTRVARQCHASARHQRYFLLIRFCVFIIAGISYGADWTTQDQDRLFFTRVRFRTFTIARRPEECAEYNTALQSNNLRTVVKTLPIGKRSLGEKGQGDSNRGVTFHFARLTFAMSRRRGAKRRGNRKRAKPACDGRLDRAVRRHAASYQSMKIRQRKPSGVSRRVNLAERVTPTTAKSNNATISAYHADTRRITGAMSVDCIKVNATTPDAAMSIQTTVLVLMPSNVAVQRPEGRRAAPPPRVCSATAY